MVHYDSSNLSSILNGQGDWFDAKLLRLIAKADQQNLAKLYVAFPEEVNAVVRFRTGNDYSQGR